MDPRIISDVSKLGEARPHLLSVAAAIRRAIEWVDVNCKRDEKTAALLNLLRSIAMYVEIYASNLSGTLEILALCTRSVFELNLRARMVLERADGLQRWIAEAVEERIETLEGFVRFAETGVASALYEKEVQRERQRLTDLKEKHDLPAEAKGRLQERQLAEMFHLEEDYDALYKLASKIVHPSSYLVNGRPHVDTNDMRNVLLITLQLKARDSLARIGIDLGIPDTVTGPAPLPN